MVRAMGAYQEVKLVEKEKNLFRNPKVVIHPSSRALKIAVIVLIVFSMIALTALTWVRNSIRNRTEDMRQEAAALEEANAELQERSDNPGALENIMDLAREFLGLEDPDTIIIDPN